MNRVIRFFIALLCSFFIFTACSKDDGGTEGNGNTDNDMPGTSVEDNTPHWISEVLEYCPAPGQFINTGSGNETAVQSIIGKKGLLSLGGFGGYVIFRFDHAVINQDGYDFVILGNAFGESSEPGIVSVAVDKNGNGKPDDDEWYELKGSEYGKPSVTVGYTVTYIKPEDTNSARNIEWTDNLGNSGVVTVNSFHTQCYFPLFLEGNPDRLVFTGSRLPDNVVVENRMEVLKPVGWGYADNYSEDYTEGDDNTKNSNKFDIANAVDASGNSVSLEKIDFVKVCTALHWSSPVIGEASTEICGAISLTPR